MICQCAADDLTVASSGSSGRKRRRFWRRAFGGWRLATDNLALSAAQPTHLTAQQQLQRASTSPTRHATPARPLPAYSVRYRTNEDAVFPQVQPAAALNVKAEAEFLYYRTNAPRLSRTPDHCPNCTLARGICPRYKQKTANELYYMMHIDAAL